MSNLLIGFLFGLGFAAWVYAKMMKSTGSNTKNSLIVAAIAGLASMLVLVAILGSLF